MNKNEKVIIPKILCIGDIILDTYSWGNVERVSPEAPIPVLKLKKEEYAIGGCGNVARNVCAAGGQCHLISLVGKDKEAKVLRKLAKEFKSLSFEFVEDKKRCTTQKKRYVSGNQQILRVDTEINDPIDDHKISKIINLFKKNVDKFNVVVISDYNKGMLVKKLVSEIIKISRKKRKIIIVDPKREDFGIYENSTIITPNFKELLLASGNKLNSEDSDHLVNKLSMQIIKDFNFSAVVTTRSSKGMTVFEKNKKLNLSSEAKEVFDVSGAGDTVVAYLAVELAKGENLSRAARVSNQAAGVAVGKFGTATVSKEEIIKKGGTEQKLFKLNNAIKHLDLHFRGKKIGFTNGCFDLIHQGHLEYLKKAKSKCDFLVLGVNTDASVKKIKGHKRPILNLLERVSILASFNFVDMIISFNDKTPIKLIKKIRPEIIFKGSDYKLKEVVGHKEVSSWGGKVELVKYLKGKSTSNILKRIKENES